MLQERWTAVDGYVGANLVPADPVLDTALRASADAGLPPISVSPAQGMMLHVLARAQGARSILEIGTLRGPTSRGPGSPMSPRSGSARPRTPCRGCMPRTTGRST